MKEDLHLKNLQNSLNYLQIKLLIHCVYQEGTFQLMLRL